MLSDIRPTMTIEEAIWVDPERMSGEPCFRGTRVPVAMLFEWLAGGVVIEEFIDEFGFESRDAIDAVLAHAALAVIPPAVGRAAAA